MSLLKSALIAVAVSLAGLSGAIADTEDEARSLLRNWIGTVMSGDADKVAALLAPEFQIIRGSGRRYGRAAYVADGLPTIGDDAPPPIEDLVVTVADDVMVVTYWLVLDISVEDDTLKRRAPRMTVFRKEGGAWMVSAHANFATPAE